MSYFGQNNESIYLKNNAIDYSTDLFVIFNYLLPFSSQYPETSWMELNWRCVTHRPHLSLLMCCHKVAAIPTHKRPRESSGIISSGAEHMNVRLRELLCNKGRNYPDSLWLGSFRLSASLCIRYGARAGRGLWLSPVQSWEPVASHLLLLCGCGTGSALFTSPSTMWDDSLVMAMSTVNYFTLHMRCWLGSLSL